MEADLLQRTVRIQKLGGVAPLITDPPTTSFTSTVHCVTDTGQMTCGVRWTLSLNVSFLALTI